MNRFENKHVLVTGGNSGIGRAAAVAFAAEGARVAITGRDTTSLTETAAQLGEGALAIASDAGDLNDVTQLVHTLGTEFGHLDAIFVNAGIARFGPFPELDEATWTTSFDINVKGPYFLIQGAAPLMTNGGSIVLNGSINAHIGMPGSSIYAATKAALISLGRTLSAELLEQGIRVNVVSPGPVTTPLYGRFGLSDEALNEMATGIVGQVPLGRFGTSDEVAKAVLHLASSESSFTVGSELVVSGGMGIL